MHLALQILLLDSCLFIFIIIHSWEVVGFIPISAWHLLTPKNSGNLLSPRGIREKGRLTVHVFDMSDYESDMQEILSVENREDGGYLL
jgi:hypothetical protein